ncbi:SH3 domain-containing protein [Pleomassaria siparia CBS 279.74]|uniref:SH3 domain-containing protein n=1 Tax=Pleomassaria siparia CBS 279.74 TaxID=1314801 RepID=A0A6G1JVA7_9PLEO|nr:SH3 domain-containing protein [Pleomassaria siparia CBS 279.74]
MAQSCISLQGSTTCPAFANASITTSLASDFPFLSYVSDVTTFDTRLREYVTADYARRQYQQRIGCSSVDLTNTSDIYARYTTSVICNSIVQGSISNCSLSSANSRPLCADSCAKYATSEQEIASSPELCGTAGANAIDIIRSDFAICSNPPDSLRGNCLDAALNEPTECGYQSNLQGLCSFCGTSSPNATDSCCVNANVEARCVGVHLPTTTSMPPLFPSTTSSASPTATATGAGGTNRSGSGLSGGAIAGIVVGSILGAVLVLAAVIFFCIQTRKRKESEHGSILNTPSPTRQSVPGPPMSYGGDGHSPAMILPGARVARMSALEGASSSDRHSSRAGGGLTAYRDPPRDDAYESPDSGRSHLGGALPKRNGSLSSQSVLAITDSHSTPRSGTNTDRNFSSPEGVASGQSEQLQFFKDYYSQDDIHPNDTVATLWAYAPRANDEFELERGDMLKVVGIWDDGWATGVKLSESTEQWEARKNIQRDSGVSNGSRQSRMEGGESDIKAFPLVCVCLPQHWRKTIEGDSTDMGAGSGGDRQPLSPW